MGLFIINLYSSYLFELDKRASNNGQVGQLLSSESVLLLVNCVCTYMEFDTSKEKFQEDKLKYTYSLKRGQQSWNKI